ncbi:50S ribosomal protein L11 methyltransferase [Brevundimonas sp.]|uniref:50S ribosomal protein L11 methyltransferase n=1 Tax=Brevundimonas sp. TaxID=1871086 RepID=UPI0025FD5E36|nr:50S ribosomal protein L11 methyltransferase [Brevundimonas sp.]
MSESAVQIIARGSRKLAEAAADRIDADVLLEGATYSILEEDEAKDVWRIDGFPTTSSEADGMARILRNGGLEVVVEDLMDADWIAMSLSGLPPVRAGRFFVYGAHDRGKVPSDTVNLRIEAGAAFGTGHHGTTVGCLEAFDEVLAAGSPGRVLDVGTGTGVLGIAASVTGTPVVVGTDIDEPSVRIAAENAEINGAAITVVEDGDLSHAEVTRHAPYDLVFANILAAPLIHLSAPIHRVLRPDGHAILSGLLRSQEDEVATAYTALGFTVERVIHHDAWSALLLRRG